MTCEVMYLPGRADAEGWGRDVEAEIEDWIAGPPRPTRGCAEHPPAGRVGSGHPAGRGRPGPADRRDDAARHRRAPGEPGTLGGLDSWFDAATFTRFGDTPSIGYGPRNIAWAHTVDEYVPVDDLVACAQALALAAVEHCGVAG